MAEDPKPEHATFAGYFNIDSGIGRARGASVFGPPKLRQFSATRRALRRPGFFGINPTRSRAWRHGLHVVQRSGSAGHCIRRIPSSIQLTHLVHQSRHLRTGDRAGCAGVGDGDRASAVYHLAMRDEMLLRFSKEAMPALPGR